MTDDERNDSADAQTSDSTNFSVLTLRVTPSLLDEINSAAKSVGLKQADIIRLALQRGIPVVVTQLNPEGILA